MDSKATLRIKSRLQKIIKRSRNKINDDKRVSESGMKTPRFVEEVKLPSLSPIRSMKSLAKPYPISKVTLNPVLKESYSLMIIPKAYSQLPLGKSRNYVNRSVRFKNDSPLERSSNTHSAESINKSLLIENKGYKITPRKLRLEPVSFSSDPKSLL